MTPSKVGRKFYGKTAVTIPEPQRKAWDEHASEKTWSDAGRIGEVLESIRPTIEKIVAQNATAGASEYLASGEVAMRASQKDVLVGIRIWNDEVAMIGEVSLRALLMSALQQARENLGTDPEAQNLISILVQIGRELQGIVTAHNGPNQPPPSPRITRSAP